MIVKSKQWRINIMGYSDYEWRKLHKGWQYEGDAPKDAKWQKDRKELFSKNGNGWWWFAEKKTKYGEY